MKKMQLLLCLVFVQQMIFAQDELAMNVSDISYFVQNDSQNGQLTKVLRDIEQKFNVYLNYDPDLIQHKKLMGEVHLSNDLGKTLTGILQPLGLRYQKMGGQYYAILPQKKHKPIEVKSKFNQVETVPSSPPSKVTNAVHPTGNFIMRKLENRKITLVRNLDVVTTLSGRVVDQDGEPLIGVNVLVKGTNQGTATDFSGEFILNNVEDDATLLISYVGYQSQEIKVEGRSNIQVILTEDSKILDEVVVVGYNTVE